MNRRNFIIQSGAAAALTSLGTMGQSVQAQDASAKPRTFRIWATSDPHVGTDLRKGRQSIRESIEELRFYRRRYFLPSAP